MEFEAQIKYTSNFVDIAGHGLLFRRLALQLSKLPRQLILLALEVNGH